MDRILALPIAEGIPEVEQWYIVGHCAHCGAPIFARHGHSTVPQPTVFFACECRNRMEDMANLAAMIQEQE
jgi:hypothetical protein